MLFDFSVELCYISICTRVLNRPHIGENNYNQYVRCRPGSNLSSKSAKFINSNTRFISCSSSRVNKKSNLDRSYERTTHLCSQINNYIYILFTLTFVCGQTFHCHCWILYFNAYSINDLSTISNRFIDQDKCSQEMNETMTNL